MADYDQTISKTIDGFNNSTLSTETKDAISNALGKVTITDGSAPVGSTAGPVLLVPTVSPGNDIFSAADIVDGSALTEALVVDLSATVPATPIDPNASKVIIGSDFDDSVVLDNTPVTLDAGAGNDSITAGSGSDSISGGAGNDSIAAGEGNDSISAGTGNDSIDGGAGFDTLTVSTGLADQTIAFDGTTLTTTDTSGNTVTAKNVQFIQFGNSPSDVVVVLDNQTEASVARLYSAFGGRKPDAEGLAFWTNSVSEPADITEDTQASAIQHVAQGFLDSAEGASKLAMSNAEFVDAMYQDVLGRAGDAEGVAFWNAALDADAANKAKIMSNFAVSNEAQTDDSAFIHIVGIPDVTG